MDTISIESMHYFFFPIELPRLNIINPQRACAARVTVVVLCVCVYVCPLIPHTLESQK